MTWRHGGCVSNKMSGQCLVLLGHLTGSDVVSCLLFDYLLAQLRVDSVLEIVVLFPQGVNIDQRSRTASLVDSSDSSYLLIFSISALRFSA